MLGDLGVREKSHPYFESVSTRGRTRTATPRLTPSRNELPRGQVTQIQRSRMVAAAVEAVEDVGYARMTVAQVISRARVSRKTFYDVFTDREDCFLAAFDHALDQARVIAIEAYERESGWRDGIRAALARLLVVMDEEPGLAKLCVVEALGAGEKVLDRRAEVLDELARVIDRGRVLTNATREPPEVTAEGVVGAIFAVLHTRVLERGEEPLTDLLASLMSMIVLPYLGARAAGRELTRPPLDVPSDRRSRASVRPKDPLEGLNMRLTYRTVRVLTVIAEHPGASNREIAEGSGMIDEGQISKLVNRLARAESGEEPRRGSGEGSCQRVAPDDARCAGRASDPPALSAKDRTRWRWPPSREGIPTHSSRLADWLASGQRAIAAAR